MVIIGGSTGAGVSLLVGCCTGGCYVGSVKSACGLGFAGLLFGAMLGFSLTYYFYNYLLTSMVKPPTRSGAKKC